MTDIFEAIRKELIRTKGEKRASRPNRTIKIELDFWTNNLASTKSNVIPKACWDFGMIHILENSVHGLRRMKPIPFRSLSELETKIEKGFEKAGIKMIKSERYRRVYYPDL